MIARKDGGPAFWTPVADDDNAIQQGMTLRDYFAAKAMSGAARHIHEEYARDTKHAAQCLAITAYEIADAMLAAREAA